MNATSALDALLVALVLTCIGFLWSLKGDVGKTREDMAALRADLRDVAHRGEVREVRVALEDTAAQVRSGIGPVVAILGALHAAKVITDEGLVGILGVYNTAWQGTWRWEREHGNPLTADELARFEAYRVQFFDKRQRLTREQVADFQRMLETMDAEKPKSPDLPMLFVLALILAAVAGGGKE